MKNDVDVFIICITYNQEEYIQKCIDGFLMQKTDFKYKIIIHDDCSADNTKRIIEKAYSDNPELIIPVYEKENQYSKGRGFLPRLFDMCNSKYIAFCEGDDYWCDPYKLQKQYDHMEKHPECSLCMHNTLIHDVNGIEADRLFFEGNKNIRLTDDLFKNSWGVHLSSYFFRNSYEIRPEWCRKYWFGDYVMLTIAKAYGELDILPDIMSVYRCNNPKGVTYKINSDIPTMIQRELQRAEYLNEYIKYMNVGYETHNIIDYKINRIIESMAITQMNYELICINHANVSEEDKIKDVYNILNSKVGRRLCDKVRNKQEDTEMSSLVNRFWENVAIFINGLEELKCEIHFTYIPWLLRVYNTEMPENDIVAGIVLSDDNKAGWGMDFYSDYNSRDDIVGSLQSYDDSRLISCKKRLDEAIRNDDMDELSRVLCLDAADYPIDKDILYYKAQLLHLKGCDMDALDEIGIYFLMYDTNEDIEKLLESIVEKGEGI